MSTEAVPSADCAQPVARIRSPLKSKRVQNILDTILAGDATSHDFASLDLPESYRAVTVHKDEVDMFEGMPSKEKDPCKSLHVEEVPLPEPGPGEALVAVMASAINYKHRVDLDLRAGLHLRVPRALRPALAAHQAARPALPQAWRDAPSAASHCLPKSRREDSEPVPRAI